MYIFFNIAKNKLTSLRFMSLMKGENITDINLSILKMYIGQNFIVTIDGIFRKATFNKL